MKGLLSEAFLSTYRNAKTPLSHIGGLYILEPILDIWRIKRRETWFETVLRTTEYNINLGIQYKRKWA